MEALPLVADIELFGLIFARMTVILMLFPIFGYSILPAQYRVGFSFFMSLLLFPLLKSNFVELQISNYFQFFWLMFREAGIGAMIGFFTRFLFAAVSFAGEFVDMQLGFSMVQMPDPINEGEMATVTGYFYLLIFGIAFLMLNGHYFLLLAVQKCFAVMPPGQAVLDINTIVPMSLKLLQNLLEIAVRLSAPIIIVMMITTFALGIIAKTMPQMNVFVVGMPLKIGIGFILMIVTLPVMLQFFSVAVKQMYKDIWTLLLRMAGS
ncbi:MAG: flagellar biosynthetic protein FliR [Chitinispirillales bacterium]|nr:flagellar biosynthetic protein FliR [Chitinispirillales bacterium]